MASVSGGGGGDGGDGGGGRPQRQRRPSAKARDMEGIDLNRIIESLSKDEEVEEAATSSAKKGSNSKRAVMAEPDSDSDGWDSGPDGGEDEEDNSDKEERARKAYAKKRRRDLEAKAEKERQALKRRLGLRSEWRRGKDGQWYWHEPELPEPAARWCMDNFVNSEPSPLLHTIFLDALLVRDLFITPRLLSPGSDMQALASTCKALTPLQGATAIQPLTYMTKWQRYRGGEVEQDLAPTFVDGAGEAEVTVAVDFKDTFLAFPARFVAGLGRPRGQVITHLTLLNLTGELCYEFADVINGPGLPNLVSLTVGGNTAPSKAANNKNGGLFPSIFTAPHDKTPRLTALSLQGVSIGVNTWKSTATLIRKTLSPALKKKRAAILAPPPKPDVIDGPSTTATPSTTAAPATTAPPATTAVKQKKKPVASTAAKKTKKPRTSSAAKAKKVGKGKASKKTKTPVAKLKTLPCSAAPCSLLRCTELRLSGRVRLPKGVLVDLLLGWQRFGTPLTVLVLDDTRVGGRELRFLAQAIESFPTLAELAVAERSLTDTTAAALIDGLAAHCRAVTALSLHRLGYYYPTPMDTHMSAQSLVAAANSLAAAAKGTEEGGSGPGLASSLKRLHISWPGLTDSDRDALLPCFLGDAPAFPALKTLHLHGMRTFRGHLLPILQVSLRRGITDIDLSFNGADKTTVKAMVAEAKATIPTLGLPYDQPVTLKLKQSYESWTWQEVMDTKRGLQAKWQVEFFHASRYGGYWG